MHQVFLPKQTLQQLIDQLLSAEYTVIGPTVRDDAIMLQPISKVGQLPCGWTDQQAPATYRLQETGKDRWFDFNVGPDSWKRFLFPPRATLAGARLDAEGWHFDTPNESVPRYAFLGVRACDLAAIAVQDRVFRDGDFCDPVYSQIRERALIIAVNCSTSAPTCFCASMDVGPRCKAGFDLSLTELDDGFVVEIGSEQGQDVIDQLAARSATEQQLSRASAALDHAEATIQKHFETKGVDELLLNNLEHAQWDDVAGRCLSCTNCTMVCPTCFCSDVQEVSSLDQTDVQRVRVWDSCFNQEMSYTAGETVRPNTRSRYRQWLTHKLATWKEQFDTSGCVGCGRCITWCPVGIDLTAEVDEIRSTAVKTEGEVA